MKTMVNIKLDKKLKDQASKLAEQMGFNLSSVISATLRHFVVNKEINISLKPKMTPYLESIISEVKREKTSDKSPVFENATEAIAWLKRHVKS